MAFNIDWIFPKMRNPSTLWNIASTVTIAAVGLFSKLIIVWLNRTRVYHRHYLDTALDKRPRGVPLLTVSNHHSCFDDPGMWGILKLKHCCNTRVIRWSLAANDICFTNIYHSWFFMSGKCIPVVRGLGVYQPAVDLCIQKLELGNWVHIFPEGKVNMTKDFLRFKWGIGRILYESSVLPIIVPIWHIGMDEILPNQPPYYLRFGKRITYNVGPPIDLSDLIESLRIRKISEPEARKIITDKIQDEMMKLKSETEKLHDKF